MRTRNLALASAILIVASFGVTEAAAAEPPAGEDEPIVVSLDSLDAFEDASGDAVTIFDDQDDPGQRVAAGITASGDPVVVRVFSAPSADPLPLPDPKIAEADALVNSTAVNPGRVEEFDTAESAPVDDAAFEPQLVVAATPTTMSVAWASSGAYSVTRQGSSPVQVNGSDFRDMTLSPGSAYTFQIVEQDVAEPTEYTLTVQTPDLAANEASAKAAATAAAAVNPIINVNFAYETFIPQAMVTGSDVYACTLAPGYTFGGDGRGYETPGWGSRTEVYVNSNFSTATQSRNKYVGTTHLYKNGVLYEEKTAPSTGIVFSDTQISSTYGQARITHSVANPFCAAGAISYGVLVRQYKSGLAEVIGTRLPAPNHAGWVMFNRIGGVGWQSLFKHNSEGFICLTGICGERSTNSSLFS